MSTPPPVRYLLDSHNDTPNERQFTRLDINHDATSATFRYFKSGRLWPVMGADISKLFLIQFAKFDLRNGRLLWGFVEYNSQGSARRISLSPDGRKITITYDVVGKVVIPPRPTFVPPEVENLPAATPVQAIRVTVTINAADNASRPSNFGWFDFDISHEVPAEMRRRSAEFGWEHTLVFPILRFSPATASTFEPAITAPLQYSALYARTDSPTAVNTATGIAIHVEDERGHMKVASYDKNNPEFRYTLRNSIHLHGRNFVGPAEYTLTGGDDYGFGGNRMVYRLRAFRLDGACPGAPVTWHDVVGIYRDWLRARFGNDASSVFYKKIENVRTRPRNAPDDEMSPHTVIANYGLDGAIDPPAGAPHLSRWLEMHPIKDGAPDIPGNANDSFLAILHRLKKKFPNPDMKFEVQAWGIEKAGFYQFICGFPPLTNLLSHNKNKFADALKELAENGIAVSVTTDPMSALFNRGRFGGHVRWKGTDWSKIADHTEWEAFIKSKFPSVFSEDECPVTHTKIRGKQYDRVWVVEHQPGILQRPDSPDAVALTRCQKTNQYGERQQNLPTSLGGGLHLATQKQICPVEEAADIYLNSWVKLHLIDQGVRVVEFMKLPSPAEYYCFRSDHQHIVPRPATNVPYTNVVGYGSWYVRRLQSIFQDVQDAGRQKFNDDPFCSFRLSHEFFPIEALAPYIDQYWVSKVPQLAWSEEIFNFVYSHLVTPLQTLLRDWAIHPGYKEARKTPGPLVRPEYMLDPRRDQDSMPPLYASGMNPGQMKAVQREREPSFRAWRDECVRYFKDNFKVVEFGVAPRAYPTGPLDTTRPPVAWNPQDPLAPTNPPTYTYNRCVQDVFHLRAHIFDNGLRAVMGERIMIPSTWLEPPLDYNDEAVNSAVRAALLQRRSRHFFRKGRMLGQTRLFDVKDLWAWGTTEKKFRSFHDVLPLTEHIKRDNPNFSQLSDPDSPKGWRGRELRDFISKGWERQVFVDGTFNDIVIHPQIEHRIWQHGEGDERQLLYAFANIGNTEADVVFLYGKGLEGVTQANPWRRSITLISPRTVGSNPPAPIPDEPVWAGELEENLIIPARSFAAVVISK